MPVNDYVEQMMQEAEQLEAEAKKLRDAVAILQGNGIIANRDTSGTSDNRALNAKPNRQAIEDLLREKGELTRSEIIELSGVKEGSVRSLLKQDTFNFSKRTGRWSVKSNEKTTKNSSNPNELSRLQQIVNFLKENGASTRKVIHEKLNIPFPTISRNKLDNSNIIGEKDGKLFLREHEEFTRNNFNEKQNVIVSPISVK